MNMDPHKVLGVSTDADIDEIRQAYRKMALQWHPDRHVDSTTDATNMFAEVNMAYQTLIRELSNLSKPMKSKYRNIPSTPLPSPKSSTESFDTAASQSRFFMPQPSAMSSQTTPSSSLGGNLRLPPEPPDRALKRFVSTPQNDWNNKNFAPPRHNGHSTTLGTRSVVPTTLQRQKAETYPSKPLNNTTVGYLEPHGSVRQNIEQMVPPGVSSRDESNIRGNAVLFRPGPPLRSIGTGASGEWMYSLGLTLEELFTGKKCQLCIVRRLLSGNTANVMIEVDIPPGCRKGSIILCHGVGHESQDGFLQNIAFVVEEIIHDRFSRSKDDLLLEIQIPWTESLRRHPKKVCVRGVDNEEICVYVDYSRDKTLTGSLSVRGAGMPFEERGKVMGRGNLIVCWEIMPPVRRVQKFIKRFFWLVK